MYKQCSKCKEIKHIDQFNNRKSTKDGKNTVCKTCKAKTNKEYREKNKEKLAKQHYDYWRNNPKAKIQNKKAKEKNRFGFNATEFVKEKCCEVCGITNKEHLIKYKERLHIDHKDNQGRRNQRLGLKPNNNLENLQILCRSCHVKKDNKLREYRKVKDNNSNTIFISLTKCAEHYGVAKQTIRNWINNKKNNLEFI